MDYKAFLPTTTETLVLPYFGGTRVDAATRRLRISTELAPGWWRFQIEGRRAVPLEPATPGELGSLPATRGHWAFGWIAVDGRTLDRIALPPEDEPPALARVVARRWYSNDLLFDTTEFEDDAELAARAALEERRPLGDAKGVVPSLRAAFGYALGMIIARELSIEVSLRELAPRVVEIAAGGRPVVAEMFAALLEQRRRDAEAQRAREVIRGARVVRHRGRDIEQRADDVLDQARARMIACRRVAGGAQLDITYDVDGSRILSIVDAETFQVIDPGICLSGAHRVLTLDAMPSVVREAIEDDHLNITRRG